MIIEKLNIAKFRDIEDMSFKFGSKVTFIAGSNGTSKTSLLGLIAQPFTFREKGEGNIIRHRTIVGKEYKTKFSDIHNITNYDDIESIKYSIVFFKSFDSNIKELPVEGEKRKDGTNHRFVVNPQKRIKGEGNYKLPVIYLGLKRLHPLGEHNEYDVKITVPKDITDEEITLYNNYHRELFIDVDANFNIENIKTSNKQMLGGKNEKYDTNGFSAGQDNISQIITAILSFRRLKNELGENYKGGLLLIDEIEATLHPIPQAQLIKTLYKIARDYKLQVILTTHSLEILKLGMQKAYENDTEIIYLTKTRGALEYWPATDLGKIQEDMTATRLRKSTAKMQILCEDDEAVSFLKNLLPKETKDKLTIISTKLGHCQLTNLANSPISKYNDFIFVLDGDQPKSRKNNIVILPGNDSPESLIHKMLCDLPANDDFFKAPAPARQVYFNGHTNIPCSGNPNADGVRRDKLKDFFKYLKDEVSSQSWNKLYKHWIKLNKIETDKFIMDFQKTIDKLKI